MIMLVNTKTALTRDNPSKTTLLLEKLRKRTGVAVGLPLIYDNPILDSLFPNRILPHEVWIRNGIVVAITGAKEVNAENIAAVLNGTMPPMKLKRDDVNFTDDIPLFVNNNGGVGDNILFRSMLTGNIDEIPGSTGV